MTNPRATFTGEPGTYTLRWTLQNGCFDDVNVTITSCDFVDFDGVNDYITFRDNYPLTSSFSLETWVKPTSVSGNRTIISKKINSDNTAGYALSVFNGQVRFNWYSASGTGQIRSLYNIGTDRWYHIAVTFNGSNYTLYVDGIDVGAVTGTTASPGSTAGVAECILGAMDNNVGPSNNAIHNFQGWIDEVRIWNTVLTPEQIRLMMNQEIYDNTAVRGEVLPMDVPGLSWSNLDGYYRMNIGCGSLAPYKGVGGRLMNIFTTQQETAPLPYTTRVNGNWTTDNTWTQYTVWDTPNSIGIDGTTPIDWNIVHISHNVTSQSKDITVLGALIDSGSELTITATGTQDETNPGHGLWVTHYLDLDGVIDLVGESQLVQKRYTPSQFYESILDANSSGHLERDQQGTANLFNYNYWSSPVSAINPSANNSPYSVGSILRDGTNSASPVNIGWVSGHNATGSSNPIGITRRWIYSYSNAPSNTYSEWDYIAETGNLNPGLGYTMKGSGVGNPVSDVQNYVFVGKPHNATITNTISSGNSVLAGNPYPSAIDVDEFILDNIPGGNSGTSGSIDGSLYFWVHYLSNNTHVLSDYEGGYAVRNLSGGLAPVTPPTTTDGYDISGLGSSSVIPGPYVSVGQGFFVGAAVAPGGQITFNNDQRIFKTETNPAESVFMRNANPNANSSQNSLDKKTIRLKVTLPDEAERTLLLAFITNGNATDDFDFGYDAKNFDAYPNDLTFLINQEQYVIQGVGVFNESAQYPLGVFLNNEGNVEIDLIEVTNFDEDIDVYIYDSLLEIYTPINDSSFTTNLENGNYLDRFYVVFTPGSTLSNDDPTNTQNIIVSYLNNSNDIYIKTPLDINVKQVSLINILGQTVMTWNSTDHEFTNEFKLPVRNVSNGNYIIKVETDITDPISKKLIIN